MCDILFFENIDVLHLSFGRKYIVGNPGIGSISVVSFILKRVWNVFCILFYIFWCKKKLQFVFYIFKIFKIQNKIITDNTWNLGPVTK